MVCTGLQLVAVTSSAADKRNALSAPSDISTKTREPLTSPKASRRNCSVSVL